MKKLLLLALLATANTYAAEATLVSDHSLRASRPITGSCTVINTSGLPTIQFGTTEIPADFLSIEMDSNAVELQATITYTNTNAFLSDGSKPDFGSGFGFMLATNSGYQTSGAMNDGTPYTISTPGTQEIKIWGYSRDRMDAYRVNGNAAIEGTLTVKCLW